MSVSSYYNPSVAEADAPTRRQFIRKTYLHLVAAVAGFALISWLFLISGVSTIFTKLMFATSWGSFVVILAFIGVSYMANSWARNSQSLVGQYLGLAVYVVLEAFIFMPLLLLAQILVGGQIIALAGFLTIFMVAAFTFLTFLNRWDFSFLGGFLAIFGFIALGISLAGILFGFSLGLWFSGAMILFASGAILYDTSNIMLHYNTRQYVAASLSLFASVALLFYYILSFLLRFTSRD
jgi:FtsH-binding integral membrane protein